MTTGRWEDWTWDATLFAGCAPYYLRGRVPAAPGIAGAIADALGLDPVRGDRVLDIGCGPGVIMLLLAPLVREAVGLDPDRGMLDAGAVAATASGVHNVRWVEARAEALPALDLGRFAAVTLAASFHWMDRPAVARAIRPLLDPGRGAAVQVDTPAYRPAEAAPLALGHPLRPTERIADLTRSYLGPDRRAGQGVRNNSPSGEDAVFQAAGFAGAEIVIVPDGRVLERSVDEIVAEVFSSSPTAPHLFADRMPAFEADLRTLLWDESPAGLFSVFLPDNELRIWRPDRSGF